MKTGWELIVDAGIVLDDIECICVRVNGDFGEVPVAEAEAWLSRMRWFADHDDDGWQGHPTMSADENYDVQIWTRDRIYRVREYEGIAELVSWPRTPEAWMQVTSKFEGGLIEIGSGRAWKWGEREEPPEPGDEMPDDLAQFDDLKTVNGMLQAWSRGRLTDDQVSRLMELDDEDDLYQIARDNSIVPPQHRDIKLQLVRGVIRATEAAGLMDQPAFLTAIGMPTDWLVRAIDDPGSVPLDEYVRVFDEASAQAGWHSAAEIIREVVDRQRFREWP